ncbi:MAG: hypothetical protein V9E98_14430 [Candidatus Nanopelagicales bacterium]
MTSMLPLDDRMRFICPWGWMAYRCSPVAQKALFDDLRIVRLEDHPPGVHQLAADDRGRTAVPIDRPTLFVAGQVHLVEHQIAAGTAAGRTSVDEGATAELGLGGSRCVTVGDPDRGQRDIRACRVGGNGRFVARVVEVVDLVCDYPVHGQ